MESLTLNINIHYSAVIVIDPNPINEYYYNCELMKSAVHKDNYFFFN